MAQTKRIDREQWADFAVSFSNGNKGRSVKVELLGSELGAQTLVNGASFFALDRDPEGKGDDVEISLGKKAPDNFHTIQGPSEIWRHQDDNGAVTGLEIIDLEGQKTILTFSE